MGGVKGLPLFFLSFTFGHLLRSEDTDTPYILSDGNSYRDVATVETAKKPEMVTGWDILWLLRLVNNTQFTYLLSLGDFSSVFPMTNSGKRLPFLRNRSNRLMKV